VDVVWAQSVSDEELRLVSYGQRGLDVLIETPYGPLPTTFETLLFQLQARGYRLLLAHPERNPTFRANHRRLDTLVERGILLQVTAGELTEESRRSASRRLALRLVERGFAHVIASDSHAPQ
jgi:protein-tyrosine phosphatase